MPACRQLHLVSALGWRSLATVAERATPPLQLGQTKHAEPIGRSALGSVLFALVLFTIAQAQSYKTLVFWTRDRTDRTLLGFEIPPDWFASLACVLVLILLPLVPPAKVIVGGESRETSGPRRIAIGLVSVALAFTTMTGAALLNTDGARANILWLCACYATLEIGEVLIYPSGQTLISALAPGRSVASTHGLWQVTLAAGFWLGGEAGSLWGRIPAPMFFAMLAVLSLGAAAWIIARSRRIRSCLQGQ